MKKRNRQMNLFYIPAVALMALFVVYPFFRAIQISFCKWNGYSENIRFVGLDNYIYMMTDRKFWNAFGNTLLYGFGSTFLQNVFGLAFALLVNSGFKGNKIVRTVVYMPIMISSLIMGYIMYYFLVFDNGVLNDIIGWFGKEPQNWLGNPVVGRVAITLINSWQYVGNSMIIYLAGLQNIPQMYYEAATIDGAGKWASFKRITMPLLVPSISSAVILNLIGGLKLYDLVVSLTNGGPGYTTHSVMSYISNQYFTQEKAGYSAAIGIFIFLFIVLVSAIGNHYFAGKEVDL
ncbi:sugar ABC transporter permease [bacterium 1xD8-48]|nr:sugar ABC transporter permease [bacterium 1xD8-48]